MTSSRGTAWITRPEAAEILGCGKTTVERLIAMGKLHPRPHFGRRPSLRLDEVEEVARRRAAQRTAVEADQDRQRQEALAQRIGPPDDGHEWLTAVEAAQVVGLTHVAVRRRTRKGTIPVTAHKGRYWFRRDHMETWANSRSARATRMEPPSVE